MAAAINFDNGWLVLSKVKSFWWMDLFTNSKSEIFVWDQAITISIEFLEQLVEVLVTNVYTPVVQVKLEFLPINFTLFILIQIHKCFS